MIFRAESIPWRVSRGSGPEHVLWHRHWVLSVPADYLIFVVLGAILIWYSYRPAGKQPETDGGQRT